jgi:dTDP-4-amino-4,6-dideoxygalactose transaminase
MIPLFKVAMNPTADKAVGKVLSSGFIGQGEVVEKFELDLKICFNNPSHCNGQLWNVCFNLGVKDY